jgi:single-strand DNA-binding protein
MADSFISITGNLAADPELRFTPNGNAVVKFRMGVRRAFQKNGEWAETTTWLNVEAWGQMAENAAASLTKGGRVTVTGELDTNEYQTEAGEKRTVIFVRANSIAPDLRFATASVERNPRKDGAPAGKPATRSNGKLEGYGDTQYEIGADENEPF